MFLLVQKAQLYQENLLLLESSFWDCASLEFFKLSLFKQMLSLQGKKLSGCGEGVLCPSRGVG